MWLEAITPKTSRPSAWPSRVWWRRSLLPTSKPRSIAREGPDSEIDSPPAKVADLNKNPKLPYEDNAFDFVTNVVSVDYLVKPREVFEEMHRVLKPGGWDVFWDSFGIACGGMRRHRCGHHVLQQPLLLYQGLEL